MKHRSTQCLNNFVILRYFHTNPEDLHPNVIKLTKNGVPQVGGELVNPNGTGDVGVRKFTTNLYQAGILA